MTGAWGPETDRGWFVEEWRAAEGSIPPEWLGSAGVGAWVRVFDGARLEALRLYQGRRPALARGAGVPVRIGSPRGVFETAWPRGSVVGDGWARA